MNFKITLLLIALLLVIPNQKTCGQVKNMIDKNAILDQLHSKYKQMDEPTLRESNAVYDRNYSDCAAKALRLATTDIEIGRLIAGMKLSAKTTISIFGGTLGKLGFKYAVDGVKLLGLLDDAQNAGGNAQDYAKAVAQFAYDKGSGILVDKVKKKIPNMFDNDDVKSAALLEMANLAKKESSNFMKKFLFPEKEKLFDHTCKSTYCTENYVGEITSKEDEHIEDHTGPVILITVTLTCKCRKDRTEPLKNATVIYKIPLDLTKNPNKGWFWQSVPDYIFVANMKKTAVHITAECCKGSDENISWISPGDKDHFISIGSGLFTDFSGTNRGHSATPNIGVQFPIVGQHAFGGEITRIFSGSKSQNNQFRSNGYGATAFYQFDFFSFLGQSLTPFVRASFPYQILQNKNRTANNSWMDAGKQRNIGINVSPGVRFEHGFWGLNAELNFLSFTNSSIKPANAPQFGAANNIFAIGGNQSTFNLRFLWRI